MASTKQYQKQLSTALQSFYQKPVAKVSIELFLSIGLVLFLALFAIRPTLITMSDLIKEIEDKQELSEQLQKKVAALSTAQTIYLSLEDRLPVLDESIPSRPDLVYNLKVLEKLATDNTVIISSITVTELPVDEDPTQTPLFSDLTLNKIPVSIALSGDYRSIRSYVEAIRANRRSFTIETVVFSLDRDRDAEKLRANITISIPYYGEKTAASAAKASK